MILASVPGAGIGVWLAPIGDWFLDCWYGAAFALPAGFLIGLIWQRKAAADSLGQFRWAILGYGLFSILLPLVGVLTYDIWKRTPPAV